MQATIASDASTSAVIRSDRDVAVHLRHLRVVRGGTTVLDDISLDVRPGQIYGLIGPSGSGKSTLIRAITGLQQVAGGEIRVLGHRPVTRDARRTIGYMPQEAALYTDLSARENLQFFAAIDGIARARVDDVLRLLDLNAVADRPVSTYSGGQQRRVSLGIAILAEPSVLLLDEPTVGLDPRLRQRLWQHFHAWAATGTTLLVSTHVMDEAARVDRMLFLLDGRVVAEGKPAEIVQRAGTKDLEAAILHLTEGGLAS